MNLAQMLESAAVAQPQRRKRKMPVSTGPQQVQSRADDRYKALLTNKQMTTGEIANAFGHSHCGTLSSLLKLETRGKIKRVGVRERAPGVPKGRPSTVWTWVV